MPTILLSQSDTSLTQQIDYINVAREIISEAGFCSLVTIDDHQQAIIRIMDPFPPEDDLTIFFGTNSKSRKVKQLMHNPNVSVLFFDRSNYGYVTLYGKAILEDSEIVKEKYWKEQWLDFYPNYPDGYSIIKFIPDSLEMISPHHEISGDEETWKSPVYQVDHKN